MEVVDQNGNGLPAIYTRNITNSPDHLDQVQQKFEDLHSVGFRKVSSSAYFNKCICTSYHRECRFENVIVPQMANSSGNDDAIVFVHDLADITMLSSHHFAELEKLIPEIQWRSLNRLIDKILLNIKCNEIYDTNNVNDPELASKFESLKQLHNSFLDGFDRKKSIISEELLELAGVVDENEKQNIRHIVMEHQKVFNQRWITVERCLKWVQKMSKFNKKYVNVILCEEEIDEAVVQLLFSGLSSTIPFENIYSKNYGEPVFERIQNRFGRNCVMIHVTSDWEDRDLYGDVSRFQIPCWWISSNDSFKQLYRAQRGFLSK